MVIKHNKLKDYLKGIISVFDFSGTSEIKKLDPILCKHISFESAINDFGNKAVKSSQKSFKHIKND